MIDNEILKYFKGALSSDEVSKVENWINESIENRKYSEQIYYTLFLADRANALSSVDVDANFTKIRKRISKPLYRRINWSVAAAFFIGLVLSSSLLLISLKSDSTFKVLTENHEKSMVILPDGTKVWVNQNSSLAYHKSFWGNTRRVRLLGEAYFEVTKDKHSPFIVNSKNVKTEVLGTKFNVKAPKGKNYVRTTLLEGSVKIELPVNSGEKSYLLKPNQQFQVALNGDLPSVSNCDIPTSSIFWVNGKFSFKENKLSEIAETLQEHYNVKFIFRQASLKDERFTCEFEMNSPIERILSILALTKRFNYEIKNHKVFLSLN